MKDVSTFDAARILAQRGEESSFPLHLPKGTTVRGVVMELNTGIMVCYIHSFPVCAYSRDDKKWIVFKHNHRRLFAEDFQVAEHVGTVLSAWNNPIVVNSIEEFVTFTRGGMAALGAAKLGLLES